MWRILRFLIVNYPVVIDERKVKKVGNYVLTGCTLGKGHFARVEEAIHIILNVKVSASNFRKFFIIKLQYIPALARLKEIL